MTDLLHFIAINRLAEFSRVKMRAILRMTLILIERALVLALRVRDSCDNFRVVFLKCETNDLR